MTFRDVAGYTADDVTGYTNLKRKQKRRVHASIGVPGTHNNTDKLINCFLARKNGKEFEPYIS